MSEELTPAQSARLTGLSLGYVYSQLWSGKLLANKIEGQSVLAESLTCAWDFANEGPELQRAIELNPNLSEAHLNYGAHLRWGEKVDPRSRIALSYR